MHVQLQILDKLPQTVRGVGLELTGSYLDNDRYSDRGKAIMANMAGYIAVVRHGYLLFEMDRMEGRPWCWRIYTNDHGAPSQSTRCLVVDEANRKHMIHVVPSLPAILPSKCRSKAVDAGAFPPRRTQEQRYVSTGFARLSCQFEAISSQINNASALD